MNYRRCNPFCLMLWCMFLTSAGQSAHPAPKLPDRADVIRTLPELHLLEPIWSSETVFRESILPMQAADAEPITGRLAFAAAELMNVESADGKRLLEIGEDVRLAEDGRTLVFAPREELLVVKHGDLFPPAGSPNSYKHRAGHPEQNLLYAEGHWFHDRQFEVTYRRRKIEWSGGVTRVAEKQLPRTLARLRAGQPLTIGVSGDSITQGYNASAFTGAEPRMPPYPDLVAAQLEELFGGAVTLRNRAISGWSITNGLDDLDNLLAERPHLVIVAYGMNDVGRRDPAWFREQTKTLLDRIHKADPEIEVILVAPMLGNSQWVHTPREMFARYRDALSSLSGPGVALADLTKVWETLLVNKHDLDLIGNGLNHPCDFGHRLYAQTVLALLTPPKGEDGRP